MDQKQIPLEEESRELLQDLPQDEHSHQKSESESQTFDSSDDLRSLSYKELVDKLVELVNGESLPSKKEIDRIKKQFYKIKQSFTEDVPEDYDVEEGRMQDAINEFKAKDKVRIEQFEKEKTTNKETKEDLLKQFSELLESKENFGTIVSRFKSICDEWNNTGEVDPQYAGDLQKQYNDLRERFYDLKHINDEFRDLDFKKNQSAKEQLIAEAKELSEGDDVIKAARSLQLLHERWREIGPTAPDTREDLWQRFKEYSSIIHKRHQAFFDERKALETSNLEKKTEICGKIEALVAEVRDNVRQWEQATQEVLSYQKEWKNIGFASKKDNDNIFLRYRQVCDAFFTAKSAFFTLRKEATNEANELKRQLIEKANALKDSEQWKETAEQFKQLQNQWKQIKGVESSRFTESLWKEFRAACDYFFDRRNRATKGVYQELSSNMEQKQQIIKDFETLLASKQELPTDELAEKVAVIKKRWADVGHVPFKHKDEINGTYYKLLNQVGEVLQTVRTQRRIDGYEQSIKNIDNKDSLREEYLRMQRLLDKMKQEASRYEMNMSNLNFSNPNSPILKEVQRKQKRIEEDIQIMQDKLQILRNRINQ